ncbi:response regulator transcription factor [Streptomyces sp. NPDC002888]|uniref:response regulator transcription factor n=1 Tax=Streptomyces sp. NPDC002888 TaxID=3364668 RepID=UPI0036ACE795
MPELRVVPRPDQEPLRVLMMCDHRRLTPALHQGLQTEGFATDVVQDSVTGLSRARKHPYDVVVLDLTGPGPSGYEICEALWVAGVWTPVLMLSAMPGDQRRNDVFDVGAEDYLMMPIGFVERMARLQTLVRRTDRQPRGVLTAGGLVLDPFRQTVERDGIALRLTPREFTLLHCLIRHRDSVLSKRRILEDVWEADWRGRSNIVELYISYLQEGGHPVRAQQHRDRARAGVTVVELSAGTDFR